MQAEDRTPRSPAAGGALLALLIVALATRPQLAAIGPLAPGIIGELGVSFAFVGLLTTIPVLCMGLFAPFGPRVVRRIGVRAGIAVTVGAIVLFGVLRPFVPGAGAILAITFGIGVGTALSGPMLSMFVSGRLPLRMVAGTAAYAGGTILGATLASAVAVPLEAALDSWRGSLLVISIACIPALVAWVLLVRGTPIGLARSRASDAAPTGGKPVAGRPRLPFRRPVAWAIGLLFGLQSWLYYGTTAWFPSVYMERGWNPETAGVLVSVMSLAGLAGILGVPVLSRHGASRRLLLATSAAGAVVALLGVVLVPAPAFLWAIVLGTALGATFTLVLTLPTDISDDPHETGGAAAMMLLVGYLLASVAPFALGAARDATGDFVASLWLLVAIAVAMIPLAWSLAPERLRPATRVLPATPPDQAG